MASTIASLTLPPSLSRPGAGFARHSLAPSRGWAPRKERRHGYHRQRDQDQ